MTKGKRYRRYSPEFKREALKRASEDGVTDIIVCEELGISARQLRRWRDEYRLLGDEAFPGQGRSRDEELTKLKRELAKVKRASEDGVTDIIVCEELGISARQLRRWRDEYRLLGDEAFPGQGRSRDEELTKLKRELAKVKQERDFLKDAAVFFAKEST